MTSTNPTPTPPAETETLGAAMEAAFSSEVQPATAADLRRMAQEAREGLINYEVSFSDPQWDDVHRLEKLADLMGSPREALPEWMQRSIDYARAHIDYHSVTGREKNMYATVLHLVTTLSHREREIEELTQKHEMAKRFLSWTRDQLAKRDVELEDANRRIFSFTTDKERLEKENDRYREEAAEIVEELHRLRGYAHPNVEAYQTISGGVIVRLVDEDSPLVKLSAQDARHIRAIAYALNWYAANHPLDQANGTIL